MDTWAEFLDANPTLLTAARELQERGGALAVEDAKPLIDPQASATVEGIVGLLCWERIGAATIRGPVVEDEDRVWKVVGVCVTKGSLVRTFISRGGRLASIPEAFFTAFVNAKRLDVAFRDRRDDSAVAEVCRGGEVEFLIHKGLLEHLIELRDRNVGSPAASRVPSQ